MNKTLGTGSIDRSARVHRIKRVIVGLALLIVVLPSIMCIILFAKMNKLERQILELSIQRQKVNVVTESTTTHEAAKAEPTVPNDSTEIINIETIEKEDTEDIKEVLDEPEPEERSDGEVSSDEDTKDIAEDESEPDQSDDTKDTSDEQGQVLKRVYLTFDDGPSSNTSKILDVLDEYDVKATFFVVGRLSDTTTPMYKRIVDEGHAIGLHSYTHKYNEIYKDVDSFVYDLERIQSLVYEQTGVMSKLYRFPGGSSNTVSKTDIALLSDELKKRDIKYFDWNVVSGDASSMYGLSKEEIVRNCTSKALSEEEAVILMHDLPEKATTVAALPDIIEYFKSIGVEILPLDENVKEVHHTIDMTE